jgi:hypothetical protein
MGKPPLRFDENRIESNKGGLTLREREVKMLSLPDNLFLDRAESNPRQDHLAGS